MARDQYRVRAPLRLPDDVDAATTGMEAAEPEVGGALRYILADHSGAQAAAERAAAQLGAYDAGAVGPPDLRDSPSINNARVEQAYNRAWNREHAQHRSRSTERALRLGRDIRQSAHEIDDLLPDYAPGVFGMRALEVPTLGLADEAIGGLAAAIDPDLDYADAQKAIQDNVALGSETHPWSAHLGTGVGMLAAAPLGEVFAPSAAAAEGAALSPAVLNGRLAGTIGIGSALGGTAGALRARPGQRIRGGLLGALTGGALALPGAAALRLAPAIRGAGGVLRTPTAVALEGAGLGALTAPGMSTATISDPLVIAHEMGPQAALGAGLGTVARGVASAIGEGASATNRIRQALAARPTTRTVPRVSTENIDEGLMDLAARNLIDDAATSEVAGLSSATGTPPQFGPSASEIANRVATERSDEDFIGRLIRDSYETDPVYRRFAAAGIVERPQIRALIRSFGGPDQALAALREAGLARPGLYSTSNMVEAARRIRPAMQQDLAAVHNYVGRNAEPISGGTIGQGFDEAAAALDSRVASARERNIINALRQRGDDFRYGTFEGAARPSTEMAELYPADVEPITLPTIRNGQVVNELHYPASSMEHAPIDLLPEELQLTYPELRQAMQAQGVANERAYSGRQTGNLTPEQESGLDAYRILQRQRDAAIRSALGEEGYQQYLARNRAFRVADLIAPDGARLNIPAARNPAGMLGQLAGMASDIPYLGRFIGEQQQRLISGYRDSLLATLNEVGTHTPEQLAALTGPNGWFVRSLESLAANPEGSRLTQFLGNTLPTAVRRGVFPVVAGLVDEYTTRARLPGIRGEQARSPEGIAAFEAEVRDAINSRNRDFRSRLSPDSIDEPTRRHPDQLQQQVDTHIGERNRSFAERLRSRSGGGRR